MKKRLLSLFLVLLLLCTLLPGASLALPGEGAQAADVLSTLGLVKGSSRGYETTRPATRAEAAVLLARLSGGVKEGYAGSFSDVPAWAKKEVDYVAAMGWANGVSAHSFAPERPVSADDYLTFLLRLLGYRDADGDFTHDGAAQFARHIGLVAKEYKHFARGDMFTVSLEALTFQKDGKTLLSRLVAEGAVCATAVRALRLDEATAPRTARQIADRCAASVFYMELFSQTAADAEPSASSSGFFITADGIAVTNYHAIHGARRAVITLITGERYPVEEVLFYDTGIDIAVLRIGKTSLEGVKTSAFAHLTPVSTDTISNGDEIFSLGSPLGMQNSISAGIIGNRSRIVPRYALPMLQNTAPISMGSSGGALLNAYGQVVGVTSGAFVYGNGMFLAVPIDPVLEEDLSGAGQPLSWVAEREKNNAPKD